MQNHARYSAVFGYSSSNHNKPQTSHFLSTGLCGGSASGKTTVAKRIISELGVPWVIILSLDSFYKVFII